MALPGTLIGAGVGAGVGAVGGAATAHPGSRLKGGLAGAAGGAVIGGGVHSGLRYQRMSKNLSPTGKLKTHVDTTRQMAQRNPDLTPEAKAEKVKQINERAPKLERLKQSVLGSHKADDTVAALRKDNPFQGTTPDEAKKLHRKGSLEQHPDRGGDRNKFKALQDQFEERKSLFGDVKKTKPVPSKEAAVFFAFSSHLKEAMFPAKAGLKALAGVSKPVTSRIGGLSKGKGAATGPNLLRGQSGTSANPTP